MKQRTIVFLCICLAFGAVIAISPTAFAAQAGERMALPAPDTTGGAPLMQALAERRTNRAISEQALTEQDISNILWAAWGFNRPDKNMRTTPTAKNKQMLEVYAMLESGIWRYDAKANALECVLAQNMRDRFGKSPLALIYTAPENEAFSEMHVGSMYQSVGLYCASAGLANVVRGHGWENFLQADMLQAPEGYKIHIIHWIGLPK